MPEPSLLFSKTRSKNEKEAILKSNRFHPLLLIYAVLVFLLGAGAAAAKEGGEIVHDGEYYFLKAQYGEKWAKEDQEIDAKLAEIRKKNEGKRPNILYILIDDVSFGQMGNRAMNYVTGISTPRINKLAEEGVSLMRMYTEPSCTPTRAAMLTGRHPVQKALNGHSSSKRLVLCGLPEL